MPDSPSTPVEAAALAATGQLLAAGACAVVALLDEGALVTRDLR